MNPSFLSILFVSGVISASAFEFHLFPAESTYEPNVQLLQQNLGLDDGPIIVEDFEDSHFIQGLRTSFSGTEENKATAWDGTRVGGPFDQADFKISLKNVRLFGIAIGDNDGGREQVTINQTKTVRLQELPFFTCNSVGRAYYLIVVATAEDPDIQTVRFSEAFSIHCDHLILKQGNAEHPEKHVLHLRDKSRLIGRLQNSEIEIRSSEQSTPFRIPMRRIGAIKTETDNSLSTIELRNSDSVRGILSHRTWTLSSILGELSVPNDIVESIRPFTDPMHLINEAALAKRMLPKPQRNLFELGHGIRIGGGRFFPVIREKQKTEFEKIWDFKDQDGRSIQSLLDVIADEKMPTELRRVALCAAGANKAIDAKTINTIEKITLEDPAIFPISTNHKLLNSGFTSGAPFDGLFDQKSVFPGDNFLPGWAVVEGRVVLRTLENPDRSQALELGPSTVPGAVTQFFPTIANQEYKVEIFACSLAHGRQGNTQAQIDVAALKKTFDCPEGEIPRAVNFEFTARHTFTTITLRGIGDAAYGPMIEKIVINPIPPSSTP